MIADTSGWGSKFFPEVRVCFRSSASVVISRSLQAALLSGMLAATAALAYLGASRAGYQHLVAKKEAAAARVQTAKSDLENRIGGLQRKLAALTRDRDQARGEAATLNGEAGALRNELSASDARLRSLQQTQNRPAQQPPDTNAVVNTNKELTKEPPPRAADATATASAEQLAGVTKTLDQTQQALQQAKAQNEALTAQLGKIQADRAAEEAQFAQYKASLEETAKELEQLGTMRGKPAARRTRVRVQLGEIWRKLSQIQLPQPTGQAAAAAPGAPSTAASAPPSEAGIADLAMNGVAAFEHALRSAGVDVTRILSKFGAAPAEGGPFVPPPKGNLAAANAVSPEKLAALEALEKTLPVSAPLAHYDIGSPFGPRVDPFNGRPSFHTGIDMDAPYSSPVYATAPGTVIYAGWLGDYGQVVEIDHGLGIVTLYAHLRRYLVSVGQNVTAQAEIGLVGTTGRSTGPHVHYEVRVDGQPQDPEKFLDLARLLPAASRQLTPAAAVPAENSR
jgi:murein DD-endopeptidase MepM/ murein hydrolase activator NlpD